MNKYRNKKIRVDGEVFDSKKEYRRYLVLKQLEKEGRIENLRRQVTFEIIPVLREPNTIGKRGGVHPGKVIERKAVYVADFVYKENGENVVEDCKGIRTKEYILKRKLMLWRHGIRVKEI